MSCSDPIADMLTCIRNASRAGLPATEMSHSRLKAEIARILKKEGFVADVAEDAADGNLFEVLDRILDCSKQKQIVVVLFWYQSVARLVHRHWFLSQCYFPNRTSCGDERGVLRKKPAIATG